MPLQAKVIALAVAEPDPRSDGLAVASYEPHREILDATRRPDCDAIFIGMHGGDPLGRFFGSQAPKVLAHSPVPVMALR